MHVHDIASLLVLLGPHTQLNELLDLLPEALHLLGDERALLSHALRLLALNALDALLSLAEVALHGLGDLARTRLLPAPLLLEVSGHPAALVEQVVPVGLGSCRLHQLRKTLDRPQALFAQRCDLL